MKSNDCFKLENGNLQLSLSPSNSVANYNIQRNNILDIDTNNEASTLPDYGRVESLCPLLQRLTVESLLPDYGGIDSQLPPLNWICSYFGDFSQCTACSATRFRECSSTLLDKLWYLYLYIYNRASSNTTIIIPLQLGGCVLFCPTLIHRWVLVSLASLIQIDGFLETDNSSPWRTKATVV